MTLKKQNSRGSGSAPPPSEDMVPVTTRAQEAGDVQLLSESGPFPLDAYRNLQNRNQALGCLIWFSEEYNRRNLRVEDGLTDEQIRGLWRDLYEACVRFKVPLDGEHMARAKKLGVLR